MSTGQGDDEGLMATSVARDDPNVLTLLNNPGQSVQTRISIRE